mgnify:CR=1 FL=1
MITSINIWLKGSLDYEEGVRLYAQFGNNNTFKSIFARSKTKFNASLLLKELTKLNKDDKAIVVSKYSPKNSRKPISFYPKELELAYKRQNYLYKLMDNLHPQLEHLKGDELKQACAGIVNSGDEIKAIYKLLDYWETNNIVPSSKYTHQEVQDLSVVDLINRRNTLRTYISKNKKKPTKALQIKQWKEEIESINIKIDG